ncbi:MAG: hypothetical protein HQM09_14650 [Candidatus Riflebacteria bacterium]|nr:hypothetical protein [Candidatus Riflebacteria bacterium]
MKQNALRKAIVSRLDKLPIDRQQQVLEFVKALMLSLPQGTPASELKIFAGTISRKNLKLMSEAIEDGMK